MKKPNIARILKRGLISSTAIGALIGLILGIVKSYLFIEANRYIELGMYDIAVYYFRSVLNESFFLSLVILILIGVIVSGAHILFLTFLKDKSKVNQLTLGVAIFLGVLVSWLFGGYLLNKASWFPRSTTFWGISLNLLFTIGFLIFGLLIYKVLSAGRYHSLMKFLNLKPVLAVIALFLILNGYFYYDKFFDIKEGTNVIFITVDTLRADHLGYSGYERDTSPNIDAFAKDAVVFSQAIAQSPQTTPSFASMLTSTYGHTNGVVGDTGKQMKIDNYFVLLGEILKNNNYNTMGIVTNLYLAREFGFSQGIETYIHAWGKVEINDKTEHEHLRAEDVTRQAVNWLRDNYDKGKFFMWVHYLEPHAAYTPPEPFDQMYVGDTFYDGTELINLVAPDPSYPDIRGVREIARLGDNNVLDYYVAQYDGEIKYVDKNIGTLLDEIRKLGVYDNTLIIFTSDHGESLGEHNYYFWHGRLPYDDCLRVPLVIKFPADAKMPSKRISQPVGLIDFLPTVLDFLNLPVPKEAEGQTLIPFIKGEEKSISKYIYSEAGYEENYQRIVRTEKWKLVYIPDGNIQKIMNNMPFELYNIQDDPGELNNLFSFEAKIAVADELRKDLFNWIDSANVINGISSPKTVEVNEEMQERLRSLGYIQ